MNHGSFPHISAPQRVEDDGMACTVPLGIVKLERTLAIESRAEEAGSLASFTRARVIDLIAIDCTSAATRFDRGSGSCPRLSRPVFRRRAGARGASPGACHGVEALALGCNVGRFRYPQQRLPVDRLTGYRCRQLGNLSLDVWREPGERQEPTYLHSGPTVALRELTV